MTAPRRHVLEVSLSTEGVQRAIDAVTDDMLALAASDIAYTPGNEADWVAPAPTTLAEALDRLAAAGGTTPVP